MPVSANLPPQAKNERADKADAVQLPGIARVLIQHQLLSPEQAREAHAKAQAAENGNFLDELVINSKVLNPLRLATFLAETFGMPLMDLASLDFSTLPLDQIDRKLLAETRVIPLIKRGNRLAVLLSDPTDNQAIERVKFQQQAIIDPIVVEHSKLVKLIQNLDQSTADKLADLIGDVEEEESAVADGAVALEDNADVDDAPIVRFLQKVLMDAIQGGASDIHFEPYEKFYRIRFRVDGPGHQGQARLAHQGHLPAGHLGEAGAAGRPDEAGHLQQPRHRLPGLHAAHAVRREDRDAYSGPLFREAGDRCAGL